MKKYLSSIFAVLLAICFSAFTPSNSDNENTSVKGKPQPLLYWYNINADGSLGSALNGGAQMDKTDALSFTTCRDVTSTDCVRGYSSQQIVGTDPAPSTSSNSDYHILKNQ